MAKSNIPTNSPGKNKISPGKNLNNWNINRKYHSGFIPTGAEEKGSALIPKSHGKKTARIARMFITINHISSSRRAKFGKKGIVFFSFGGRFL
jgi:hypothetical protein